ncbi:hypothetical protein AN958_07354 [Leucoagaricus sp. SymC.cos]|nr:hypothetical protein AN958_07354 [Leucoagaricus sp. SymC.cos]
MMIDLSAILFFTIVARVLAFNTGFYHIQNVASGKNVEARQQGLPLFVEMDPALLDHKADEEDYAVWRVGKRIHGHNAEAVYTLQHNATKMYAQAYKEAFNTTIMIAEKYATPLEFEFLGGHEWAIKIADNGTTKSVWTIEEPNDQVTVYSAKITRKGIPRASQRFIFHPIRV